MKLSTKRKLTYNDYEMNKQKLLTYRADPSPFYSQFPLYKKCWQHAGNHQNIETLENFLTRLKELIQTNDPNLGWNGFQPPQKKNVNKIDLWTKTVFLNELAITPDISPIFSKRYKNKIDQKIINLYSPIMVLLLPTVLYEIILDYSKDNLFYFSCILSNEIWKHDINLIVPSWQSIFQCQVPNCDFWK